MAYAQNRKAIEAQTRKTVEEAIKSLNTWEVDYHPEDISMLCDMPLDVVMPLIQKAGWCEMGHQYSVLGFYEMA